MSAPSALVTKRQLLDLCAIVERERLPAVTSRPAFRPGHGLNEVRKVIRAFKGAAAFDVADLGLALMTKLAEHEPWDRLGYELLQRSTAGSRTRAGVSSRTHFGDRRERPDRVEYPAADRWGVVLAHTPSATLVLED